MPTSQQEADRIFEFWRLQARMGIPPAQRRLPEKDAEFERDMEVLRQVMERSN